MPSEPKEIIEFVVVLPLFALRTMLFSSVMEAIVTPPETFWPETVMPTESPAVLETLKVVVEATERPERVVPPSVETAPTLLPLAATSPPSTSVPPAKLTLGP